MKKPACFQALNIGPKAYQILLIGLALAIALICIEPLRKMAFAWELDSLTIRQKLYPIEDRSSISPIRLIKIDAKTQGSTVYQKLFGNVLTRRAAGYAIRFLNRTRTRATILDLSFNRGANSQVPENDQFLAQSVLPDHPVISQLIFENQGESAQTSEQLPQASQARLAKNTVQVEGIDRFPVFQRLYTFDSLVPPYTELLNSGMRFYSAAGGTFITDLSGQVDDTQGNIRRWAPFSLFGNQIYPTVPLGALLSHELLKLKPGGLLTWGQHQLDLGEEGVPLIKWYGHGVQTNHPVYPEVSFVDVVLSEIRLECEQNPSLSICKTPGLPAKPTIQPDAFRDQFALVGFTLANVDQHQTIYSAKYPGVYILANSLDNALHNDFVKPAPFWINLSLTLIFPILLALLILRFRSALISLLLTVTLSIGYFLLCLHAYQSWNLWLYLTYPVLGMWACFSGMYAYQYAIEQKKRQQMRFAFGKYVSPAVLQIIENQPEKITLGGERREMTFMFSDIRGFTQFSDINEPEVVQTFLSQYFSTMNGIIMQEYRGSINKLIGDAIMAYWGFPLTNEDHAFLAVSAAMAMREAMLAWREQTDKLPINIGIGINTGEAVIGNVGSEDFMDFTVIGDAVNVASRLEGINKNYGTNIIISAATYNQVKDRIHARSLGWAELKGKGEPIEVFEPLSFL